MLLLNSILNSIRMWHVVVKYMFTRVVGCSILFIMVALNALSVIRYLNIKILQDTQNIIPSWSLPLLLSVVRW